MRNSTKYLLLILTLFYSVTYLHAQEYCMASPIGFGSAAKGGTGGTVVAVDNYADLKTQLTKAESTKLIVIITKDITFDAGKMINVKGGKTILGMPGVRLISTSQTASGGILQLSGNDIIIRNLTFEGPGAYDVDGQDLLQNTGCTNLWVDHCEFYDGVDGNFDNTKKADNVTISWCKFGYKKDPKAGGSGGSNDHRFTNLVGGSKSDYPADGHYNITFQYCYWSEGCRERMPRARNAELHLLNCYYATNGTGDKAIGLGGGNKNTTCYVEGCNFKDIKNVYAAYSGDGGTVALNFIDCIGKSASNIGTVTRPGYAYSAIAASAVEEAILSTYGAGATLSVNEQGKVWIPNGGGSALNEPAASAEWGIRQIGNTIEVNGVEAKEIAIYSLSGGLLSHTSNSQSIPIGHLEDGVYTLAIETADGEKLSKKFIKQ